MAGDTSGTEHDDAGAALSAADLAHIAAAPAPSDEAIARLRQLLGLARCRRSPTPSGNG